MPEHILFAPVYTQVQLHGKMKITVVHTVLKKFVAQASLSGRPVAVTGRNTVLFFFVLLPLCGLQPDVVPLFAQAFSPHGMCSLFRQRKAMPPVERRSGC